MGNIQMGLGEMLRELAGTNGAHADVFARMLGQTIVNIGGLKEGSENVTFTAESGDTFVFWHSPDCCETVEVVQIDGDVADLLHSPLLMCEDVSSEAPTTPREEYEESFTWTFYKFATVRGYVTVRWYGSSNGYYSETVHVRCEDVDGQHVAGDRA